MERKLKGTGVQKVRYKNGIGKNTMELSLWRNKKSGKINQKPED